jgi:hypothetical protein
MSLSNQNEHKDEKKQEGDKIEDIISFRHATMMAAICLDSVFDQIDQLTE